jgi:hypothetical protein
VRRFLQVLGLLLLTTFNAQAQVVLTSGFEGSPCTLSDFKPVRACTAPKCDLGASYAHSGICGLRLSYQLCGNPITDPSTLTTQTAGGALAARTYYVTYTNTNGTGETGRATTDASLPAAYQATASVGANNYFKFTSPPANFQMTSYNVYAGTVSGTLYLQTFSGPIALGTDWTEPNACPGGHSCIGGTNLVNDTAAPPATTVNTAGCGGELGHRAVEAAAYENLPAAYPDHSYDNGLTHFWFRGYVQFRTPTNGGAQWMQRKMLYFKGIYDAGCTGGGGNCWHGAPGGPPGSRYRFWLNDNKFAGNLCPSGTPYTNWGGGNAIYLAPDYWTWNTWYAVEWEVKTRSNATTCDGIYRLWLDGVNLYDGTALDVGGNYFAQGQIEFDVGNQTDVFKYLPMYEDRYWDDIVLFSGNTGATPSNTCSTLYSGNVPCIGPLVSGPGAQVAPVSVAFNDTNVGDTSVDSPEVVTLTNNGGATLNISSIAITGAHAADFSKAQTCGATLAVSDSCTVSVSFTPGALGARTGNLVFTNDASGSPQIVALSGTGTGAPPAPTVQLSPLAIGFYPQIVGITSGAQLISLYNSGDATLNITSIVASGDFARTTTCGATLAAAASCEIDVTFSPTAGGARTGAITVTSDAASSPDVVALSGVGLTTLTLKGFTGHFTKN